GHPSVESAPRARSSAWPQLFTDLWAAMVSGGVALGEFLTGTKPGPDNLEALTLALHERALATPSTQYMRSLTLLQRVARGTIEWGAQFDLILTPALAKRP